MRGLDRRLGRVEVVAQRRHQAAAPYYDVSALSPEECYELDALLARAGAAHPTETWATVPITPDEEVRLSALAARVQIVDRAASCADGAQSCHPQC